MGEVTFTQAQLDAIADAVAAKLTASVGTSTRIVPGPARILVVGPLEIDVDGFELKIDGRDVRLKPREFEILAALAQHAGRYLSRAQLLAFAAPEADIEDERTIDVHVLRLRRALGPYGKMIQTMNRVGYRMTRTAPTIGAKK
jgi:two-component system phosphate regulon response regulator PhoB